VRAVRAFWVGAMSIPALIVSQQSREAIGKLGAFVTGPAIAAAPPPAVATIGPEAC
jgi:hypothetical protein